MQAVSFNAACTALLPVLALNPWSKSVGAWCAVPSHLPATWVYEAHTTREGRAYCYRLTVTDNRHGSEQRFGYELRLLLADGSRITDPVFAPVAGEVGDLGLIPNRIGMAWRTVELYLERAALCRTLP